MVLYYFSNLTNTFHKHWPIMLPHKLSNVLKSEAMGVKKTNKTEVK